MTTERTERRHPLRRHSPGAVRARWSLVRVFVVGAILAALVAIGTVTLGVSAMWRLSDARAALLDQAGPAVIAVRDLTIAQLDQETAVRGYVITGQRQHLDPYYDGIARSEAATAQLLAFADELPEFAPDVEAVTAAEREWRAGYAEPVITGGPVAAGLDGDRALFGQVREATGALEQRLATLRSDSREHLASAANYVAWAGGTIGVTLLVLLGVVGFGLRRMVLRPVSALAGQVREVVGGDPGRQVQVEGPDELRELGADVEAMRRYIQRDLDEAQALNQRLDEQARELERSNRDLEQFAYVASHDLQEPLRKVSSFCQLLQRRYSGQLDERADQYIEFAVDGAHRMQRLINDLLAFSRVGRSAESFTTVDLDAVAATARSQLEATCEEAGGKIEIGALPTVSGDPGLLQALLVNLVGNGIKFHREDVPPVVRVDARRDGDEWEISVVDNGIGIEPEYGEKVFVIFQRLHGRDVYPGTGIGLALAKKIVEFHGGRIGLVETDEPGTIVRFSLPALPEETAA